MRFLTPLRLSLAIAAPLALLAPAFAESTASLDAIDLLDTRISLSGNYLAARSADQAQDIDAAAHYYNNALNSDPRNPGLMERALLLGLASGDMARSFTLAERLIELDPANPAARVSTAVEDIKQGKLDEAVTGLSSIARADLATLTAAMMTAWIAYGEGRVDDAVKTIAELRGPEWYEIFKNYHTALILDAAGRNPEAIVAIKRAYTEDTTALRVVDGYARILTRGAQRDEARRALVAFAGDDPLHPVIRELFEQIRDGKIPPPTAATPAAGIAELLYGLGSAIGIEDGMELAAAYLRLATYLDPEAPLVTMALGDVFQAGERCEDAIAIYETVPETASLRRNADIQIGNCLQSLERPEDAIAYIEKVVAADPGDFEAAMELGNVHRASEQYAEAAEAYTVAIAAMTEPASADWRAYYFRGISLERNKRWAEAERDFREALRLEPDQPQVLNYLGYSWVDQGMNLGEALKMIQKAVELRPNDGYIVDSLGWAYYRLGRYPDAVNELEEAVSLNAADPVINDHLGDAYWQVGRKREALFQWAHARDLDPPEADLPKILAKLEKGLEEVPGLSSVLVEPGESLSDIAERVYGDAARYQLLLDANRDKIPDPDVIRPGMTLTVPAPGTAN